jgi:uncharacterized paraquat-inducible protein A
MELSDGSYICRPWKVGHAMNLLGFLVTLALLVFLFFALIRPLFWAIQEIVDAQRKIRQEEKAGIRHCANCGRALKATQSKYCSRRCSYIGIKRGLS